MQVARLTFAARRRSDRPFRISPLTIYEAKFREKLTKNFQFQFEPAENQHQPCLSDIEDVQREMRRKPFIPQRVMVECGPRIGVGRREAARLEELHSRQAASRCIRILRRGPEAYREHLASRAGR